MTEHEERYFVTPIGVRYKCEFCNEGTMKFVPNDEKSIDRSFTPPMMLHSCTSCGKTMYLPKVYPYIEWEENPKDID
jgi:DNA-directed RNA polymerase subunit RPC12/RpoP